MEEVICLHVFKFGPDGINWYTLKNKEGIIRIAYENSLKDIIKDKRLKVTNLELTKNQKLKINNKCKDDVDKYNVSKYKAYELFESKQNLVGKMFNFFVSNDDGIITIYIDKYYDNPNKTEVSIPWFVDGFRHNKDSALGTGAFNQCKYIKKVIMGTNVKGSISSLFEKCFTDELDLSEFNTQNVNVMTNMFRDSCIRDINMTGMFTTINCTHLAGMFANTDIENLNFNDNFNTSKAVNIAQMFKGCIADTLHLGNRFITSKVEDMSEMFLGCRINHLVLGKNFDTSRVANMGRMFNDAIIPELDIGDKFNTRSVNQMGFMFSNFKTKKLSLGNLFYTKNVTHAYRMFTACEADYINLGSNFMLTKYCSGCDNMFSGCKVKNIILQGKIDRVTMSEIKKAKLNVIKQ